MGERKKIVLFFLNVRIAEIFFLKIVLIVRVFKKCTDFLKNVLISSKKCTNCTNFFRKLYGLYGLLLKMYEFFQKSFGHPEN